MLVWLLLLAGCEQAALPVPVGEAPERLSDWHLLSRTARELQPRPDSITYDLHTPLFSDYAHKLRTVWMPPGTQALAEDDGRLTFPVGTVITKTFYYPVANGKLMTTGGGPIKNGLDLDAVRLIETRLLVHRETGWEALPYVWNDEQTDAQLAIAGDIKPLSVAHHGESIDFPYVVPTRSECASCHAWNHASAALQPIGPTLRHLRNHDQWTRRGKLAGASDWAGAVAASWPPSPASDVDHAARSYLDINCGHCHSPIGPADTSGLYLHFEETSLRRLGACKQPVAAGRGSGGRAVSIAPGDPDASILHFRMQSTDPGQMMPEIGRSLVHAEGVALIADWIRQLDGECVEAVTKRPFLRST